MSAIADCSLEELKDELAAHAAHMSAGMCRYLELVGECDRRGACAGLGLDRGVACLALRADAAYGA